MIEQKIIKIKKYNSLTGLRFYMMVIIMLSHMEFLSILPNGHIYSTYFHNANLAVNFFFILSGFGLAHSYQENNESVTIFSSVHYGVSRIRKIYPLYITLLFICLPYCIYLGIIDNNGIIITFIINIFKLLLNISLLQSATGISQLSNGLNSVSWFLSTLFILYIFCPLLLKINEKIKKKHSVVYITFVVNTFLLLITYFLFKFIESRTFFNTLSYSSPYLRIFYLISGILLCDIMNIMSEKLISLNTLHEFIITAFNVFWFFFRNSLHMNFYLKYFIDYILCILLILIFAFEAGKISKFISNKIHVKLGYATKYWFLIHCPVRLYVNEIFVLLKIPETWISGLTEVFIIVIFTIIITNFILKYQAARHVKS